MAARKALLWLWKILPLPVRLRWAFLWLGNSKFLAGALAAIFDAEGRVLLQHHTYRNRCPWGMPGGWIRAGERLHEALAREVAEETGLQIVVGPLVAAQAGKAFPRLVLTYLCLGAAGVLRLSAETDDARYFQLDTLPPGLAPDQIGPIRMAARARALLRNYSQGTDSEWEAGHTEGADFEVYE